MDFLDAMMAPRYRQIAVHARALEKTLQEAPATVDEVKLAVQMLAYDVYVLASTLAVQRPEDPMPVSGR